MRSGLLTFPRLLPFHLFAAFALYVAAEFILFLTLGVQVITLHVLPVMFLAWRFGPWLGIVTMATLLAWEYGVFLPLRGVDATLWLTQTGWLGVVVETSVAIVVGRLSEFLSRLRVENAELRTPLGAPELHLRERPSVIAEVMGDLYPVTDQAPDESGERMRASAQRFEIVARATKDVIYDWNIAANDIWWSENAGRILGHAPDQITPTIEWWKEFIHPDDRERVCNDLAKTLKEGEFWEQEYRFRCGDGNYAFVHERGYVLRNDAGIPVRMIGSLMDVTGRRQAEDALRHREEFFRAILENSTDNVTVMRPDGLTVYESPSIERVSGYTPDELVGQNTFLLIHPDDVGRVLAEFEKALTNGEVSPEVRYRYRHKDGEWRKFESVGRSFHDENGQLFAIVHTRDITEREHLEQQLRQAQKMEAIGNLAGGIAHDFNNLLTVIMNYSYLASDQLAPGSQIRSDLGEIMKASERAAALTRQLLAFSRKQVLRPEATSFNTIVEGLSNMLSRLIGEDIELQPRLAPDLWSIEADIGQMEQMVLNLMVNARDAMPTGGVVTIETRNETLKKDDVDGSDLSPGEFAVLAITDTGSGMDFATQQRVFEPFFTTKAPGKGTGLGLSTVYGIVQQSGGRISVRSDEGAGTTFTVHLPRTTSSMAAPEVAAPAEPPARSSETILLVEDEHTLRHLTKYVLEKNGYTVLEAESALAASRVSAQHPGRIHLLLTDVVMPGDSGRQLAEELQPRRPDMRVLYMSGYTDDEVVRHGIQHDQVRLLQKPFNRTDLLREVGQVLNGPCANALAVAGVLLFCNYR